MKVVETQKLKKTYHFGDSEVVALAEVDVVIEEREFVAIWGPSGSGKSTLCNLMGLLDTPTSGEVIIRGELASGLTDAARSSLRNDAIGFVFQNFNLIPVLTALENVMLPLQISGIGKKAAREKAESLLREVELADRMHHRPQKMSGGQQQRVAIARALVTDPALVIADEPTANLDTRNANLIIDLMRKINQERGAAFVFSTHDDRLLDRVDRKIQLRDGEILEDERVAKNSAKKVPGVTLKKETAIVSKKAPASAAKKAQAEASDKEQVIPAKKAPKKNK
jgi:putative ABC transport system ATP-binding protein